MTAATGFKENRDLVSFLVTKHSWKGKYKRVLSVGSLGITTYNPTSMEITNQWAYPDVINVSPIVPKSPVGANSVEPTMTTGGSEFFELRYRKKNGKPDVMKFSSEFRSELLCEVLRFKSQFFDAKFGFERVRFNCYKMSWSERKTPMCLEIDVRSVNQLDASNGKLLSAYSYKDIDYLVNISDVAGGFIISTSGFGRHHMFIISASDRADFLRRIVETAWNSVGWAIRIKKETIDSGTFAAKRFGKYSGDDSITSLYEFQVHKRSKQGIQGETVKRILALTDNCLVERDTHSYSIISVKPLNEIFALIRSPTNAQLFVVEFLNGNSTEYLSTDRDALLASLLDGVRASGNIDIHVRMTPTPRGARLGPLSIHVDEEVESHHLKFLQTPPPGWTFADAVSHFNANCAYSGLLHSVTGDGLFAQNKERLIQIALGAFVERENEPEPKPALLEQQFQALRRLVASKAGFAAFTLSPRFREYLGIKVVKALKTNDEAVIHSAIDMLCALMQPMHDDYDLRQEQLNKSSLLSSKPFLESLLEVLKYHVDTGTGALVVASMLDFLTFSLCAPYSETTDGAHFDMLLTMVAASGRLLFKLFQHPSLAIVKGAGLIMKSIIQEGDQEVAVKMQDLALAEGALPRHLHIALYQASLTGSGGTASKSVGGGHAGLADGRTLALQELSRQLIALWIVDNETSSSLLQRVFPEGLLRYLDSDEKPPKDSIHRLIERNNLRLAQDHASRQKSTIDSIRDIHPSVRVLERHMENVLQHWRERIGIRKRENYDGADSKVVQQKPVVLRRRRERIKSKVNWTLFFYQFHADHARPNLIWNHRTREELKDALEAEMRAFGMDKELAAKQVPIAWNHIEFEVPYTSLNEEIRIGGYFLRLLLEAESRKDGEDETSLTDRLLVSKPYEFFNSLYHRFLLSTKPAMKGACLQAMAIVYGAYHTEIGEFADTSYILRMLASSTDRLERDRLLQFISKLILHKANVKILIDSGGLKTLVDLVTLAHLHVNRAVIPTKTNVIEASPEMAAGGASSEQEWHYGNAEEKHGPVSFDEMKSLWADGTLTEKTLCWAQGLERWMPLVSVPQLKWSLLASGISLYTESDLALLILNIFITVCGYYPSRDSSGAVIRPIPKIKRFLSDAACFPHIIQLVLTFDPILVEKVATLTTLIMQDNPALSRLYLFGTFFFLLMYTGSNLLPIGELLAASHSAQAFRFDDKSGRNSSISRSILGPLLPEAMVCYLDNHGPSKFAETFLGEFDTPEAIWSSEMRRLMIEKIAAHIADFSPRLKSNNRALYQYCPIPAIAFPQLENELFCNIFYLKNLCNIQRFPNWPIHSPVDLLRDILHAWKDEVEKKPPSMSTDDAVAALGIKRAPGEPIEEAVIRKAYFRMATKYHPDKNPEGREKFEEMSKAYDLLCAQKSSKRIVDGPDPVNIALILQAQSILFKQCATELHPYKYAGYPMLVKTLRMETADEALFSKETPLLAHAAGTAYHTVACSALNAEELRREGGLEILQEAFARCVNVLSASSKPDDTAVQVCVNVINSFTVAAAFPACRERIARMSAVIKDICRVLYYQDLSRLCLCAVECLSELAADAELQTQSFEAGVLFSLLLFMFSYDYTLDEGGVAAAEESNQQQVANRLAKVSVVAASKLSSNPAIRVCLDSLLTPYLCKQLSDANGVSELLKTLNSNVSNPYLIWDNGTRAELTSYLENQQREMIRSGVCPDESYGKTFRFSSHEEELIIGGVFVRLYNEQPAFPLTNAKELTVDLLDHIGSQAQYLQSAVATLGQESVSLERLRSLDACLEALWNVIGHNTGVELQCLGHFKLLFSLLKLQRWPGTQIRVMNVISSVTSNKECVGDIAAASVLVYLLLVLYPFTNEGASSRQRTVVETLLPLVSNSSLVKEAIRKGAVLYLLDVFANTFEAGLREKTAELLAKMTTDKLVGPKVRLLLARFLPLLFIEAMKDSPSAAVHMYDAKQENPELIWNDDTRDAVGASLKTMASELYALQATNPTVEWKPPDDLELKPPVADGEIVVAGVYLRLFIDNPAWVLRRPRDFLTELLNRMQKLFKSPNENDNELDLVTKALTSLLHAQPSLLDLIPPMGFIPGLVKVLSEPGRGQVPSASLLVLNQLAKNQACVDSMVSNGNILAQTMAAMKTQGDRAQLACETLQTIFTRVADADALISQALKAELVPFLLKLLDGGSAAQLTAATKAVVVELLKSLGENETYGEQIKTLLNASPIWSEFRDQKHDLFLSNNQFGGYISNTPGVAGYLTQGGSTQMPSTPPPM